MADLIFDRFAYHVAIGDIDLDGDTFKIALLTTSYTPDSTDEYFSDLSAYETDATNYPAGGQELDNVSVSEASGVTTLDANDETFINLTGTNIKYAVVYDTTASNLLVCLFEFSITRNPTAENLKLTFDSEGLFDFAQAA